MVRHTRASTHSSQGGPLTAAPPVIYRSLAVLHAKVWLPACISGMEFSVRVSSKGREIQTYSQVRERERGREREREAGCEGKRVCLERERERERGSLKFSA